MSLAVEQQALMPAFSPEVHDYVVRCQPGVNALALDIETDTGVTASVITPSATTPVGSNSQAVAVEEDDPIVVRTAAGAAREEYWVRCIPHDFPQITFALHPDAGTPTPGWYLTGNASMTAGEDGFAMILDHNGTPVWYQRVGPQGVINLDRQPDGTLSYIPSLGAYGSDPQAQYVFQKLVPWQTRYVQTVGGPSDEHEMRMLPNGDLLTFSYVLVGGFDLTGLQTYGPNTTIADCTIEELSPTGALVWSWRASDHIDPVKESLVPLTNVIDGVSVADVFHFNSIDVDSSGNLLVSARALSAVFYVDKASGKMVWKMGGQPYSKDGAQIIQIVGDAEGGISAQHDARFQPNGDVSVFDDHSNLWGNARGLELALDFASSTAKIAWQYAGPVPSTAMGSFRRYSDGSNVIDWGLSPKNPVNFTEVDDQGNDLLDVTIGTGDSTYRAVKLPIDTFDAETLRATAGHS